MQSLGLKVGILDADIYGPSLPAMIPPDAIEKVYASESGGIIPLQYEGAPLMSAGFLRPGDFAAVRGPMASAMVQQMLTTTEWGDLDVLLIDMPPGTGDIHLTVAQQAKVDAAIVVTTPQVLSLVDVEKGIRDLAGWGLSVWNLRLLMLAWQKSSETLAQTPKAERMFDQASSGQFHRCSLLKPGYKAHLEQYVHGQVKIPTVAIVENMSFFVCNSCGAQHEVFQRGAGEKLAQDFGIQRVFRFPLDSALSRPGLPYVLATSEGGSMDEFRRLAAGAMAALEELRTRFQPGLRLEVNGALLILKTSENQEMAIPAREVLLECRSAKMRDEFTGKRLFREEDIPQNVVATKVSTAGRYAVNIDWSNSHKSLFSYDLLAQVAEASGQVWHAATASE
ncbi:HCF101 [Symbiodinium sp. CCMP2456]|nr:HCF101 [Symbiodinium sp. CCMP2456]